MGLFLNQNIDVDQKKEGVQKAMGDYVYKFWHLLDETLNAILFILIGLEIIPILQSFDSSYLLIAMLTIILVVVSRGIGVWAPIKFLSFFKIKTMSNPSSFLFLNASLTVLLILFRSTAFFILLFAIFTPSLAGRPPLFT